MSDINSMEVSELELPSLTDVAQEPSSGAWPEGWYRAKVVEGYATRNGTQFTSGDTVSKNGDSRNLLLCFIAVNAAKEERQIFNRWNYKAGDFDRERILKVLELRKTAVAEKWGNKWPEEVKAFQATSLSLGRLGQIERAVGFKFKLTEAKTIDVRPFIGQEMDLHFRINESGYNEVSEVAKAGERTSGKKA